MWLCAAIICGYVLRLLYVQCLLRLNVVMCCDYMWLFVAVCVTFVATECLYCLSRLNVRNVCCN